MVTSKTQAGLVHARTELGGAERWHITAAKSLPLMDGAAGWAGSEGVTAPRLPTSGRTDFAGFNQ